MKKISLCGVLLLIATFSANSAGTLQEGMNELAVKIIEKSVSKGKTSIAISYFPHINGDKSELSNYIADELVLKLFDVPNSNIEIIERGQLNQIFHEMNFNMTGVVDSKTIQQLGKVHGVGALVLGSITEMGESIRINARLINTETGRVFSAAGTTISKTATIKTLLTRMLKKGTATNSNLSAAIVDENNSNSSGPSVFNIDLMKYSIGDMPEALGMVTVENGKRIKGKRVLKGFQGGAFEINLPGKGLHGDFEILFTGYYLTKGNNKIELISAEKTLQWKLKSYPYSLIIGDNSYNLAGISRQNNKPNHIRIIGKGRVIKYFVNDKFVASQVGNSSTNYNKFKVTLNKGVNELGNISFIQN